jgi:hypothetical protein
MSAAVKPHASAAPIATQSTTWGEINTEQCNARVLVLVPVPTLVRRAGCEISDKYGHHASIENPLAIAVLCRCPLPRNRPQMSQQPRAPDAVDRVPPVTVTAQKEPADAKIPVSVTAV